MEARVRREAAIPTGMQERREAAIPTGMQERREAAIPMEARVRREADRAHIIHIMAERIEKGISRKAKSGGIK